MTKNVGAYSLSCIAGSRLFVTQYNVMDILAGWRKVKMRKCCIPKATTTIKIVIPLVTFFSLAKIQIIHLFANSLARAGWLDRSGGDDIYKNSISTY